METLFLKLLNMSIIASWLVLIVMVIRILFKKVPKITRIVMWGFVGLRLVWPFSFVSIFSLIPSVNTIPENIMYLNRPRIQTGISPINEIINPFISDLYTPNEIYSANPLQIVVFISSVIWIVGMIIMLLYTLFSYLRIRSRVVEAVPLNDNIYLCDQISTPFILGMMSPCIYLPSDINEQDIEYVIAHENAHLKRLDHWWKPIGFLLLSIYWFNPILWLAYYLFCKDIELACDEKVINEMDNQYKKPYSMALINCSSSRKHLIVCPLAFGEVAVEDRIKTILDYKKPKFWVVTISTILCIGLGFSFLTNPKIENWQFDYLSGQYTGERIIYENHRDLSIIYTDDNIPQFMISNDDFSLYTNESINKNLSSSWYEIGRLEKIELNTSEFDELFNDGLPHTNLLVEDIRENNINAFSTFDASGRLYYFLEQNSGEIYIAQGYTDTNDIRWIFKMK